MPVIDGVINGTILIDGVPVSVTLVLKNKKSVASITDPSGNPITSVRTEPGKTTNLPFVAKDANGQVLTTFDISNPDTAVVTATMMPNGGGLILVGGTKEATINIVLD